MKQNFSFERNKHIEYSNDPLSPPTTSLSHSESKLAFTSSHHVSQQSESYQETAQRPLTTQGPRRFGATWRAILIGTVLTVPNVYWILDSAGQGYPTTISLYFNVIFCIFFLTGANLALKQTLPRVAFQQGELLTIYVMLAIASSLAGHDVLRVLIPIYLMRSSMQHQKTTGHIYFIAISLIG